MDDFGTKQDNTSGPDGQFTATEANSELGEVMNMVLKSGQALDLTGTDLVQFSDAMGNYTSAADFYTATGTDTYILSPIVSDVTFDAPTQYIDGMSVRAFIANPNTGASTINVGSLGAKSVFNDEAAVTAGVITGNCKFVYSSSDDRFNLINNGTNGGNSSFIFSLGGGVNLNKTGTNEDPTINLDSAVTNIMFDGVNLKTDQGTSRFLDGIGAYPEVPVLPGIITVETDEFRTAGNFNYEVPVGATVLRIICIGGGGGGGSVTNLIANASFGAGGGGGSGGYAEDTINVTPGDTYTLVVGAGASTGNTGGTSSVTLIAAEKLSSTGGLPGEDYAATISTISIAAGGKSGDSTLDGGVDGDSGEPGKPAIILGSDIPSNMAQTISGNGGSNPLGAGGAIIYAGILDDGTQNGVDGTIGGGGSGAVGIGTASSPSGGNGGDGAIYIAAYQIEAA